MAVGDYSSEQYNGTRGYPTGKLGTSSKMKVKYADYTTVAGIGAADTVDMMVLPANAVITSFVLTWGAMGGAVTMNVGERSLATPATVSATRWKSAENVVTAGTAQWGVLADSVETLTVESVIQLVFSATPAVGEQVQCIIQYFTKAEA